MASLNLVGSGVWGSALFGQPSLFASYFPLPPPAREE
jgi:hypothetical protein